MSTKSITEKTISIPGLRRRVFPESNYSSVFINGQTLRIPLDRNKEITELRFSEFYDISPASACRSGKCPWCYASASPQGRYWTNLAAKVDKFFGTMTENQRPFQVAVGGSTEPYEHEELEEMLAAFVALNIVPNCTTNGVLVGPKQVEMTKKYCGGVAVTAHPHLEKSWRKAIELFYEAGIKLNIHTIVSDKESIDRTERLYNELGDKIDYFVILPHMNVGFAAKNPKTVDYESFGLFMDKYHNEGKLAIGANGYPWMVKNQKKYKLQLYSPEIFSKYLLLNDNCDTFNNSFSMTPVKFTPGEGFELGKAREF